MEISVRSPHGQADVSVVATATTTLADVVGAVTGQAVPTLVAVDRRPVPAATLLVDSEICNGSVLAAEATGGPAPPDDAVAVLVQLGGPGTGRRVPLEPGRYRLGPGRRVNDRELRPAPVESAAFELEVAANGGVHVEAIDDDVCVDGVPASGRLRLGAGSVVSTATRAFLVEAGPVDERPAPLRGVAGADGTVVVTRPARPATGSAPPRPVVDALLVAQRRTEALWERRPDDDDAFAVDVGVVIDGGWRAVRVPVHPSADAATAAGLGVVGSESMRLGLARTLLVELATAHSPRDLHIVVVTTRPASWEWSKWLPHLRVRGWPAIVRPDDVAGVVDATTPTVIVADDPSAWMHVDGPLRSAWPTLPHTAHVVALCSTRSEVPSICTTTVDEQRTGRVSITGRRRAAVGDVIPALADEETAEAVARLLSPLVDDADAARDQSPATPTTDWFGLAELPPAATADDVRARWSADDADGRPPDSATSTTVRARSLRTALDVAAGLAIARAAHRPPDRLRVLPVTDHDTALAHLPHADPALGIEAGDGRSSVGVVGVDRLQRRLRALLAGDDGPDEVLLVVEAGVDLDDRTVADLVGTAGAGISVIVASDAPTTDLDDVDDAGVAVTVEETATAVRLRIDDAPGGGETVLARPAIADVEVRPFVFGRRPTDAERRLAREQRRRIDPDLERLVRLLAEAAPDSATRRALVPAPAPTKLALVDLLGAHPGDGVPLGLVDRPDLDELVPWWWQPGGGSVLAVGRASTAVGRLADTALAGLAARLGDDEPGVLMICGPPERDEAGTAFRRADIALLHDEVDTAVLDLALADELVVVVDGLHEWSRSPDIDRLLREVLRSGRVIATAHSVTGIEALLPSFDQHLLGPSDDPADAARLGVADSQHDPDAALLVDDGSIVYVAVVGSSGRGDRPATEVAP